MEKTNDITLPNDTSDLEEGDFVIFKQPDGNYKGWSKKYGKTIMVREGSPESVLQRLLTHE